MFQSHRLDQSTDKEGASPRPQGSCSRAPREANPFCHCLLPQPKEHHGPHPPPQPGSNPLCSPVQHKRNQGLLTAALHLICITSHDCQSTRILPRPLPMTGGAGQQRRHNLDKALLRVSGGDQTRGDGEDQREKFNSCFKVQTLKAPRGGAVETYRECAGPGTLHCDLHTSPLAFHNEQVWKPVQNCKDLTSQRLGLRTHSLGIPWELGRQPASQVPTQTSRSESASSQDPRRLQSWGLGL